MLNSQQLYECPGCALQVAIDPNKAAVLQTTRGTGTLCRPFQYWHSDLQLPLALARYPEDGDEEWMPVANGAIAEEHADYVIDEAIFDHFLNALLMPADP